jgi:hypothetical protein
LSFSVLDRVLVSTSSPKGSARPVSRLYIRWTNDGIPVPTTPAGRRRWIAGPSRMERPTRREIALLLTDVGNVRLTLEPIGLKEEAWQNPRLIVHVYSGDVEAIPSRRICSSSSLSASISFE